MLLIKELDVVRLKDERQRFWKNSTILPFMLKFRIQAEKQLICSMLKQKILMRSFLQRNKAFSRDEFTESIINALEVLKRNGR